LRSVSNILHNFPAGRIAVVLAVILMAILLISLAQESAVLILCNLVFIIGLIAFLVTTIILLNAAFDADTTTGLLFLFVPVYSLFYAFNKYDGESKRLVLTGWIVGSLLALTGEFIVSINYDWWEWFFS